MAEPLREFIRFIWWMYNCAKRPPTQDQARRSKLWVRLYRLPESTSTIAIYYYYSARKLIIIYLPTEGRRLSRPSWLVTYRNALPVHRRSPIRVLTGSDVAQLRWSRPTALPLSHSMTLKLVPFVIYRLHWLGRTFYYCRGNTAG